MNKDRTLADDLPFLQHANTSLEFQASDQARKRSGHPPHPALGWAGGDPAKVPPYLISHPSS